MLLTALSALLFELTAGLLYISESDRPFTLKQEQAPVTIERLRSLFGISGEKRVVETRLDVFFGPRAEPRYGADPGLRSAQIRYEALRNVLLNVPGVRVIRFESVESDWVIVVPDGAQTVLLHTRSVET